MFESLIGITRSLKVSFKEKYTALYFHAIENRFLAVFARLHKIFVDDRPIVFSLVANNALYDSRVLKEAAALVSAGYRVTVYCLHKKGVPDRTEVEGIKFRRSKLLFADPITNKGLHELIIGLYGQSAEQLRGALQQLAMHEKKLIDLKLQMKFARRGKSVFTFTKQQWEHNVQLRQNLKTQYRVLSLEKTAFIQAHKSFLLSYFYAMNFLSLRIGRTPNIIHAHDIYTLPAAIGLAKYTGAKVVYDAHEIETERVPPLPLPAKKFVDETERHWMGQIDDMIVVSESIADFYSNRFLKKRPTTIANSPDFQFEDEMGMRDVRAQVNLKDGQKILIYVGIVGREPRGLHVVCQALVQLPEFHLIILGPRHDNNDRWLSSYAQTVGVGDRVHLLQPVSSKLVVNAIKTADVGIIAIQDASLSYRYCMPNKIFEMAFAGLPVCVSNLPEMAKFVTRFNSGIVMDQTSSQSIAAAVLEADRRRNELRLSDVKLSEMKAEFGWQSQVNKLKSLYDALETQ
jgi:glycosyltransferase involved in cell wall biosynthesis